MRRLTGIAGVLFLLTLAMWFTALNGGQRITMRLGLLTLYRVPVSVVVFAALLLGMVMMLVAGIASDLKVRRILRDRLAAEDHEERSRLFVDHSQQDLFEARKRMEKEEAE
ncbi:MAG TPA: hypothetical protein VGA70_07515 [Longimicrobiales bacterium]